MKTNQEKNQDYDTRAQARVRPAPKNYDFEPLETIMQQWGGPAATCAQGEDNE